MSWSGTIILGPDFLLLFSQNMSGKELKTKIRPVLLVSKIF